jgi:alkaline phosphatase
LADTDRQQIDVKNGGLYVVAERTPGLAGPEVLKAAADSAIAGSHRLFGFFGVEGGHLPYQTADGRFDPTIDMAARSDYFPTDIKENPTLAEMTREALRVLESNPHGFWLMVEAGDVDWANHANNIDNSIGAVLSGDAAFRAVVEWVERNQAWDDTAVILTGDHGHYLQLVDPTVLTKPQP